ncbi:hypothetical protein MNBD_ALPHA03-220 [hydrothermal vent metagenome]|uniref:Lipoprotein n=1 Tax=hydrothermal vent metagenome TaxID=652676 RepID=A0A3B1B866_9ZZZZ
MYRTFIKRVLFVVMLAALSSCGDQGEAQKETIEDRLINSFRNESPQLQEHVTQIVQEARMHQYQQAMNKLALLSATRRLTKDQKIAVELLSKQLRYDMEEEIFQKQSKQE